MSLAIYATYLYVQKVIAAEGGPVQPNEDPFVYNQHHGAFIEAWSTPGHKMTWSLLESAAVALWNAHYMRDKYRVANFTIWVVGTGMVGVGNLCKESE